MFVIVEAIQLSNDDEHEPLAPSPVSSSRDDDDDNEYLKNKKRDVKGGRKNLINKSQLVEYEDEMGLLETDNQDSIPISSLHKFNKSEASENKIKKKRKMSWRKRQKTMMISM